MACFAHKVLHQFIKVLWHFPSTHSSLQISTTRIYLNIKWFANNLWLARAASDIFSYIRCTFCIPTIKNGNLWVWPGFCNILGGWTILNRSWMLGYWISWFLPWHSWFYNKALLYRRTWSENEHSYIANIINIPIAFQFQLPPLPSLLLFITMDHVKHVVMLSSSLPQSSVLWRLGF